MILVGAGKGHRVASRLCGAGLGLRCESKTHLEFKNVKSDRSLIRVVVFLSSNPKKSICYGIKRMG